MLIFLHINAIDYVDFFKASYLLKQFFYPSFVIRAFKNHKILRHAAELKRLNLKARKPKILYSYISFLKIFEIS